MSPYHALSQDAATKVFATLPQSHRGRTLGSSDGATRKLWSFSSILYITLNTRIPTVTDTFVETHALKDATPFCNDSQKKKHYWERCYVINLVIMDL